MSQAVKCHPFLYADDSCFVCKHKDINEIEKHLNVDFVYVIRLWIVRIRQNHYSLLLNLKRKTFKNLTENMGICKSNNILR